MDIDWNEWEEEELPPDDEASGVQTMTECFDVLGIK